MSDKRIEAIEALLASFDEAAVHFSASRREFALGCRSLLEVLGQADKTDNPLAPYVQLVQPYSKVLLTLLDLWLAKNGPSQETQHGQVELPSLTEFRELLVHQLMRLDPGCDPDSTADERPGVLMALSFLDQYIEQQVLESIQPTIDEHPSPEHPSKDGDNTIQWIKVEE